jgi:serine---pyruvate transaminase
VAVQHSETSTGAINDIEAIAAAVDAAPGRPLLMVDAVSSAGAVPVRADACGLDLVCGGSHKALGAMPGIGFVSVSERAWAAHARATCPRFYWDFDEHRKAAASGPETPWTPAVGVLAGLGRPNPGLWRQVVIVRGWFCARRRRCRRARVLG